MDFFNEIKYNTILVIVNIVLLLILSFTTIYIINKKEYIIENNTETEEVKEEIISSDISIEEQKDNIFIDIKGAVKNPGVYEVEHNSKVIDIINIAGGLKTNANTKYINLSKKLINESVIYIYTNNEIKELASENKKPITECKCPTENITTCVENKASIIEVGEQTEIKNSNQKQEETKTELKEDNTLVNINKADKTKLTSISGIGDAKANAIIKYREENGNFKTIEDIKQVSGISDSLYEKIKDYITV